MHTFCAVSHIRNAPLLIRLPQAACGIAVCFLALCGAVARAAERSGEENAEEIVLGAILPLSGIFENYGQSAYYGIQARVNQLNGAGGVDGKPLRVEIRDSRSDPKYSVEVVHELAEKTEAVALVGPLFADSAIAVEDFARRLRIPIVSPLSSWRGAIQEKPWLFRVGVPTDFEAESIARFQLKKFWGQRCVILYDPRHAFSNSIAAVFEKHFEQGGGSVVWKSPMFDFDGNRDFRALLRKAGEEKPDFIFCASYAIEATEIIQAAREESIPTRFCAPNTWDNELVYEGSGRRLEGTCISSSFFEQSEGEEAYEPFQSFFTAVSDAGMNNPDGHAASAYDAVSLVAEAIGAARMPEEPEGTETEMMREAIRDSLLTLRDLPLSTGSVSINPDGSAKKQMIIRIVEVRDDKLQPVYAGRFDP